MCAEPETLPAFQCPPAIKESMAQMGGNENLWHYDLIFIDVKPGAENCTAAQTQIEKSTRQ